MTPENKITVEKHRSSAYEDLRPFLKPMFFRQIHPSPKDSCVVSPPNFQKFAALFFDRVWMPPTSPDFCRIKDICFYTASDIELMYAMAGLPEKYVLDDDEVKRLLGRHLSEHLHLQTGIESTCLYSSTELQNKQFKEGSAECLTILMSNIPLICPEQLSWEQVAELRKDRVSANHLRRFKRWLDADMKGKEIVAITDEICIRIDNYQHAINKHGLQTKIGIVSSLLDSHFIKVAGGAGVFATLMAGGIAGAGATIALGLSKIAIGVAQRRIDTEEFKRTTNPEIAYVIELQKLEQKKANRYVLESEI